MRCIAISKALTGCSITFLGSKLGQYKNLIPADINCIDLPLDTPVSDDEDHLGDNPVDCLHYAPLNVSGLRKRNLVLTRFFSDTYPLLLIVDVSVEVTLLARLCGVPTMVTRQHGNRNDLPHLSAYESASALLAPYPQWMEAPQDAWLLRKTIHTGGFSRYVDRPLDSSLETPYRVAILTGAGGTSIDLGFVRHLGMSCKKWTFEIIGLPVQDSHDVPANVHLHGLLEDPFDLLIQCQIVIGNAGHNTVMEMATLKKRFIVIPETRPFDEQMEKASILSEMGLAVCVKPEKFYHTDWDIILSSIIIKQPDWKDTVDPDALINAATAIKMTYRSCFQNSIGITT
jgi:hypothetical protein